MKKQLLILGFASLSIIGIAQTTRTVLYEEFTGEDCGPCASTNPGLNTLLLANPTKVIPIKWQVDIPTAPTATWSLFQTDKTEIQWRAYSYGYAVSSAPNGRIDGQNQTVFGATSNHPGYMTQGIINAAQAVTSPFTINMTRAWDPTFSSITVTVSITAAQTFTCAGPLRFRLVMVEKEIHFATAPGSNGEKDFYSPVRQSYPTIQNGTSLPTSWTLGQNQTFTVNCVLPSYINYKAMVQMVGFIQDDATRKVQQAAITNTVGVDNDAMANGLVSNYMNCGTPFTPVVSITNMGGNTISTMTIAPVIDGVPGTPYAWSGSLAAGGTTTVSMPAISPAVGAHTYSFNVTSVNGTGDAYVLNNSKLGSFAITNTTVAAPIIQPFTLSTFPPVGWYRNNQDNGTYQFSRIPIVGAYATTPLGAVKYDSYDNPNVGDRDELYLPQADFTGLTSMKLTFDVAYAQVGAGVDDGLDVMVSTNCGATWTNVYSKYGAALSSAPSTTAAFTPTGTQWRSEVVNLSAYDNLSAVMVKFVPYNAYGNSMWLDNINLTSSTDIKNAVNDINAVDLYPNPAQDEATLRIMTTKAGENTITVMNNLGQVILQKTITVELGGNALTLDTKNLSSGLYHVIVADKAGSSIAKKLTISK